MSLNREETRLSRFLSKILRHEPALAGLAVDAHGWADVDALLAGAARAGHPMTRETLAHIVAENDKQRFRFSPDGRRIRANQGHSFPVDLDLPPAVPPAVLYHGTTAPCLPGIWEKGLLPMGRQAVHLSADAETARMVGGRRGRPVIFQVDAAAMAQDGLLFYCAENGVWLCSHVPAQYLAQL